MTAHDIKVAGFEYGSISTGAAALAHQTEHVNGASDDANQPFVFSDEELPPKLRTAEQENAHRNLQRAFLSWERALQKTADGRSPRGTAQRIARTVADWRARGGVHDVAAWAADTATSMGSTPTRCRGYCRSQRCEAGSLVNPPLWSLMSFRSYILGRN